MLLLWPVGVVVRSVYHPGWGAALAAAGGALSFVCGAGLLALGHDHWPAGRLARWGLWAGVAAGFALIITARGDMRDLRVEDTIGLVLTVTCTAVLLIWYAARRIPLVRDEVTAK